MHSVLRESVDNAPAMTIIFDTCFINSVLIRLTTQKPYLQLLAIYWFYVAIQILDGIYHIRSEKHHSNVAHTHVLL